MIIMPTHPNTMTAIEFDGAGGPEVLRVATRPTPTPKQNQVLIKVAAAGINRPDCMQREGKYPPPKGASDIPGLEVAGTIFTPNAKSSRFQTGDEVIALVTGGGYAQYVVADEACILPKPNGISMAQAACIPETFFTVWHNVFQRGALKPGETLLVHGGTSGIGTTAIQLANQLGSKVIITAGTKEKCEASINLGAHAAINYREEDFVTQVEKITGGKGADVILDMVGGDYTHRNYKAAAVEGRIVQIAFLAGPKATIDLLPLMLKRLTHTGSTLRARDVVFKKSVGDALEKIVWPLISQGKIKPIIDSEFLLEGAQDAHRRIEQSAHIGKIVLRMKT